MMVGLGMGLGGGILMVLFWVVLIVGAVWLVRGVFPNNRQSSAPPRPETSADEILQQRYARGEITKEQFDQMRRDLNV
jgi:putative membrane protein